MTSTTAPGARVTATDARFYHVTEQDLFEGAHLLMMDRDTLASGIDPGVTPCCFGTVIEIDSVEDGLVHYHAPSDGYPCFVPIGEFVSTKGEAQYWIPEDPHDLPISRRLHTLAA